MSSYIDNQNSLRRWDNILNNLRNEIAILKKLVLKGKSGPLTAGKNGKVVTYTTVNNTTTTINGTGTYGIGRIYLDENLNYTNTAVNEQIPGYVADYETPSTLGAIMQDGHHFVVPETVSDISLIGYDVFLEIDFHMSFRTNSEASMESIVTFQLIKNNSTEIGSIIYGQTLYFGSFMVRADDHTLSFHDIIKCAPGDTFDLFINTPDNTKYYIISGSTSTSATFNIVSIAQQL